jgi:ribosome-binding protein aMBF1 (putative translation factor)
MEDDQKKTKYIAKVTSDAVRVSRCEKKLTQKELAQKCNMDVSIISEIERGGCVYNQCDLGSIRQERLLHRSLPMCCRLGLHVHLRL